MRTERIRELLTEALRLLDEEEQAVPDCPHTQPNGDVTLSGKVGRPEFVERKGIALWEAGLKILDEEGRWKWINIQAWRKTAIFARDNLLSAAETTAVGKWKSEAWTGSDGEERSREIFVVTHFIANDGSPSLQSAGLTS